MAAAAAAAATVDVQGIRLLARSRGIQGGCRSTANRMPNTPAHGIQCRHRRIAAARSGGGRTAAGPNAALTSEPPSMHGMVAYVYVRRDARSVRSLCAAPPASPPCEKKDMNRCWGFFVRRKNDEPYSHENESTHCLHGVTEDGDFAQVQVRESDLDLRSALLLAVLLVPFAWTVRTHHHQTPL